MFIVMPSRAMVCLGFGVGGAARFVCTLTSRLQEMGYDNSGFPENEISRKIGAAFIRGIPNIRFDS